MCKWAMVLLVLLGGCVLTGCDFDEAAGTALVAQLFDMLRDVLTGSGVVIPGL